MSVPCCNGYSYRVFGPPVQLFSLILRHMTFELLLAEGKVKPQQITALHLLSAFAILGTGSVFFFFYSPLKWWGEGLLPGGLILLFVSLLRNKWLLQPQVNRVFRILELMVALCLTSYMAMQ